MTKATQDGRRLKLEIDGIDEPFYVDPLPAKRGKKLTEDFILASIGQGDPVRSESIFIETFGPANYSRMSGSYVELILNGDPVLTFAPDGEIQGRDGLAAQLIADGGYYGYRDATDEEPSVLGEPIRQEEGEALCLAAFYWQTVVGMEAVNAFIAEGEGTAGSLKALGLLQIRLGLSQSPNSRSEVTESLIQQAGSKGTPAIRNSSENVPASVRLPAHKRSIRQNVPRRNRK